MNAGEIISLADELVPNPFSTSVKLFELNRLEQRIRVDILMEDPETVTPITEEDITANDPLASVSIEDGGGGDAGGGEDEITLAPGSEETGEDDPPGDGGGSEAGSGGEGENSGEGSAEEEGTGDESGQEETETTQEPGQLALTERYRDVYLFWMKSMYYWHMGEYDTYQNEKGMFEEAWERFKLDMCYERHMGTGG